MLVWLFFLFFIKEKNARMSERMGLGHSNILLTLDSELFGVFLVKKPVEICGS